MTSAAHRLTATSAAFVAALGLLGAAPAQQQKVPMQAQAQRAALRPMKLDVHVLSQGLRVGMSVPAEIVLLDANNQNSSWERTTRVQVEVTSSSGAVQKQTVNIPTGHSLANFNFLASEPGLALLKATDVDKVLLPGGYSVLINRAVVKPTKKPKHTASLFRAVTQPRLLEAKAFESVGSSWSEQMPEGHGPQGASEVAQVLLNQASGKDEILADGKDFARIQVFFMDPNGNPAPADIKVWLSWSNGDLHPQPLVIKKGNLLAEAEWVSNSPADARVSLVAVAPRYEIAGKKEIGVSFVPPIYGIGTPSPNPLKLSLIDAAPLTAQFFDQYGRPILTNKMRRITFISSNPALHLDPSSQEVQPNESGTAIFLIPTWSGRANLDIWTPGYDHQTLTIEVTMWLVLLLCIGGGVVGGIAARQKLKGSVLWRAFVGVLGGIVLVWLVVYAVLPLTHSVIAHNLVSVFVVGILGGYGGTGILDWGVKRLTGSKAQAANR